MMCVWQIFIMNKKPILYDTYLEKHSSNCMRKSCTLTLKNILKYIKAANVLNECTNIFSLAVIQSSKEIDVNSYFTTFSSFIL